MNTIENDGRGVKRWLVIFLFLLVFVVYGNHEISIKADVMKAKQHMERASNYVANHNADYEAGVDILPMLASKGYDFHVFKAMTYIQLDTKAFLSDGKLTQQEFLYIQSIINKRYREVF